MRQTTWHEKDCCQRGQSGSTPSGGSSTLRCWRSHYRRPIQTTKQHKRSQHRPDRDSEASQDATRSCQGGLCGNRNTPASADGSQSGDLNEFDVAKSVENLDDDGDWFGTYVPTGGERLGQENGYCHLRYQTLCWNDGGSLYAESNSLSPVTHLDL